MGTDEQPPQASEISSTHAISLLTDTFSEEVLDKQQDVLVLLYGHDDVSYNLQKNYHLVSVPAFHATARNLRGYLGYNIAQHVGLSETPGFVV